MAGRIFGVYFILMNIVAFALMGIDKQRAIKHKWRISELTLFIPVLLGGGIGGVMGMQAFRHKTKHLQFKIGFPLITILWGIGIIYIAMTINI